MLVNPKYTIITPDLNRDPKPSLNPNPDPNSDIYVS